jgi:hypothetical protein
VEPVYIWVRETVDWADEATFTAQLPEWLRPSVEVWNETFSIPFHLFRHRVREIAELNHSRVEGATVAGWDEIPDGALVLPVDDDDWYAPAAATVVARERDPAALGYYWPGSWIEVPVHLRHQLHLVRRRLLPSTPPTFTCATNAYAVVKDRATDDTVINHVRASDWFDANPERVRHINARLSLANRTLGSITTLRRAGPRDPTRALLRRRLRQYRRLYQRPLPDELAWAKPYAAMMAELMSELQIASGKRSSQRSPNTRLQ